MNKEETTPPHSDIEADDETSTSTHSEDALSSDSDSESEEQKQKNKSFLNFSRHLIALLLTGTTGLVESEKASHQHVSKTK